MPEKNKAQKGEAPNADSDFLGQKAKKDPNIAALLALGGMFILGLPSLAYLYVGNSRKALVYSLLIWGGSIALILFGVIIAIVTLGIGLLLLIPIAALILLFELAIVYDVYKMAKGEKPLLPQI